MQAATHYSQATNTVPDMVVYTSLFWDIGRNDDHFPDRVANTSLPADYLLEWCEHFRTVLRYAKVGAPRLLHSGCHVCRHTSFQGPRPMPVAASCHSSSGMLAPGQAQTSSARFHVLKTSVMPLEDCERGDGSFAQPKLGKRGHFAAMTAIAMQVAQEEGWGILNMDQLVAQLPPVTLFMPDTFHPKVNISLAGLNVLLNALSSA